MKQKLNINGILFDIFLIAATLLGFIFEIAGLINIIVFWLCLSFILTLFMYSDDFVKEFMFHLSKDKPNLYKKFISKYIPDNLIMLFDITLAIIFGWMGRFVIATIVILVMLGCLRIEEVKKKYFEEFVKHG